MTKGKTTLKSAGPPAGVPPTGMPLGWAWRGLLAFYLLALALNAASLHRNNEQMPYGPLRSFWVAVSAPAARVAAATGLDRPRAFLARTIGAALNR